MNLLPIHVRNPKTKKELIIFEDVLSTEQESLLLENCKLEKYDLNRVILYRVEGTTKDPTEFKLISALDPFEITCRQKDKRIKIYTHNCGKYFELIEVQTPHWDSNEELWDFLNTFLGATFFTQVKKQSTLEVSLGLVPLSLQSELKAGGVEDVTKPFGICTYLPQLGYSYIEYYKFNPSFVGRKFCQLIYNSIHITADVEGIGDLRLTDDDCSEVLCHFEQLGGNSSDIVILPTSNLSEPNQSEIIQLLQQQGVMKECYKKVRTDSTIKSISYILQELKDDESDARYIVSLQQMKALSMLVKNVLLDKSLVGLARSESTYSPNCNCITVPTLKFYESGLDHLIPTVNPLLQSTSKTTLSITSLS